MRILKGLFIVAIAVLVGVGMSGVAEAFHDGGVAYCEGCHTMHNSRANAKMSLVGSQFAAPGAYLLQGSDQSSTCLNCHGKGATLSGYHIYSDAADTTVPQQLTPGGDFLWLKKSTSWTVPRGGSSAGQTHGHNVIALDKGLVADTRLTFAPGGSYPAGSLSCISCHDPHGKYRVVDAAGTVATTATGTAVLPIGASGSYGEAPTADFAVGSFRLLAGNNYKPASYSGAPFNADPPIAVAPTVYNRSENAFDTRVAYGKNMSEWCANCHSGIYSASLTTHRHPAANIATLGTKADAYNVYKKSGDYTNTSLTSFTSLVSTEEGSANLTYLLGKVNPEDTANPGTALPAATDGPGSGNNVMCLTCHRAHASGFESAMRWNVRAEFITIDGIWPGTDQTGEAGYGNYANGYTQAEYKQAMYGRDASQYAFFQRSLCNKCHLKD